MAQGGKWEEFRIGELFDKKTIKGYPKRDENLTPNPSGYHIFGQNIKYQYPQKVLLNEKYLCRLEKPILAYTSSVAEIGMIEESFYRSGDNGAFQGLFPKFKDYNKLHLLFMLIILQKQFDNFGYSTSMSDIVNLKILLPVNQNGEIAFEFMESYIKELEAERIQELEAYLEVTGLKDYELDAQEREALAIFASSLRASEASVAIHTTFCHTEHSEVSHKNSDRDISAFSQLQYDNVNSPSRSTSGARGWVNPRNNALNLQWREFSIGDLFEKLSSKYLGKGDKFKAVSKIQTNEYNVPVVYAKFGDNGIMYWAKSGDFETHKNVLSVIYNGAVAAGLVYAQPYETGILAEAYFIKLKNYNVDFKVNLFLQCVLLKTLYPKYSREYLATWSGKVETDTILLPVNQNGEIAFDFMEIFISAVQKEVIKSVVLWKQKRITTTKAIVENR
ncbi:restriction endonuclease subunit S [Helicobacter sp. 23-1048]